MKKTLKTLMLALVASLLLFASCKKDEDLLIGTWSINMETSLYRYIAVHKHVDAVTGATYTDENGNQIEERTMGDLNITACELHFSQDGTCNGFYTRNDKTTQGTVAYTLNDNTLTLDGEQWEVLTLTQDQLVIERTKDAPAEKGQNQVYHHLAFDRK